MESLEELLDISAKSPNARNRPLRKKTAYVVLHRIKIGHNVHDVVDFFTNDPEGVATVTMAGTYKSKLPTIEAWRTGKDKKNFEKHKGWSYTPYHIIVDTDGWAYKPLDLKRVGAHAPYFNENGIGLAFFGDFRAPSELTSWEKRLGLGGDKLNEKQLMIGKQILKHLFVKDPDLKVITHDFARAMRGQDPKGCPGHFAEEDVRDMISWARGAADLIRQGTSRF